MIDAHYIPVKRVFIPLYTDYALYCHRGDGNYILYKRAGIPIRKIVLERERHPPLFIHENDRAASLKMLQTRLSSRIDHSIASGNAVEIKQMLVEYVEEALSDPRSGTLRLLPETTDMLITKFSKNTSILKAIASMASKDYTTIAHSVNVMAFTMGFCFRHSYPEKEIRVFSLAALLHDLGKIHIPRDILAAPRRLTDVEFEVMENHTLIGFDIIKQIRDLDPRVAEVALMHHEKINGGGYPRGIHDIPFICQLIGFVDAYEALTSDERPYRRCENPFKTLFYLKKEMEEGRYSRNVFVQFTLSLE